jgi:hypothetical protein
MKVKLINVIVILLVFINHSLGQTEFLVKKNKVEALEIIEILKSENITSIYFKNSLDRAITNYISYHYYAPEEAIELFDLILKKTRASKDEYYKFLLLNVEVLSYPQIELIKSDLAMVLDKTDYLFYNLVSSYHLDVYKETIARDVDAAYFSKLRTAFNDKAIPVGLLEKAKPLIALANLGDVSMEDSIINIIGEFYSRSFAVDDSLVKKAHYIDLYFMVVPKILANLNSKRSVEQTLYLMLDDYTIYLDHIRTPVYEPFVNYIITPKVSGSDYSLIQMTMFDYENGNQLKKRAFVNNLYDRIKNSSLNWKKTLNDVDK